MTELNLYGKDDPLVVDPAMLIEVVRGIIDSGREEEFLSGASTFRHPIEVSGAFVDYVKTFLFDAQMHEGNPTVMKAVGSPPGQTSCFPKRLIE